MMLDQIEHRNGSSGEALLASEESVALLAGKVGGSSEKTDWASITVLEVFPEAGGNLTFQAWFY